MSERRVKVADGPDELAAIVAEELVSRARTAISERGRFTLALSGGSTPKRLYERLASTHRNDLDWSRVHLFWSDERAVGPDDEKSNFRMTREAMLDALPLVAANVHRIEGERTPAQKAAEDYETALAEAFGLRSGSGALPRFDCILLGMGADGHTASLFPGTDAVDEARRWVVAPWVEAQGSYRVTLTLPVINAAAAVMFVISGPDKAAMLARVWNTEGALPAQRVRPLAGELLWFVDAPALTACAGS